MGSVKSVIESFSTKYAEKYDTATVVKKTIEVSGGCINNAIKIECNTGNYFLKWHDSKILSDMFVLEAQGLKILAKTKQINIPEVLFTETTNRFSYMAMAFIESGQKTDSFWLDFGTRLALLHKNTNGFFGLEHDNYIGTLPQSNKFHKDWIAFFTEERLEKIIIPAFDKKLLNKKHINAFENLYKNLPDIFPTEKPALLHGDLWAGNFICGSDGQANLIDPAVYYGFREVDIAMSKLFGGFHDAFYSAYNNEYPMENGWEERIHICNLYPLLVHLNLFGLTYLKSIEHIIKPF